MQLPEVIAAKARGERVAVTNLVKFDFEDEPFYAWEGGAGIFRTGGHDWRGLGEVGKIGSLPLGAGDTAGRATFSLSGVDSDIVRLARSEAGKVAGRKVTVWKQFLSAPQRALDDPIFLGSWIMMSPRFSFSRATRTISVEARSIFSNRRRRSNLYYSDAYQQEFYPGDLFFEFTPLMVEGLVIDWPKVN